MHTGNLSASSQAILPANERKICSRDNDMMSLQLFLARYCITKHEDFHFIAQSFACPLPQHICICWRRVHFQFIHFLNCYKLGLGLRTINSYVHKLILNAQSVIIALVLACWYPLHNMGVTSTYETFKQANTHHAPALPCTILYTDHRMA